MNMSRVTEYLVCKAIADGTPVHEETLVQITQRPAQEVHQVLVKLYPDQFGTPGVDVPYRETAPIAELVTYARPIYERHGIDAILTFEFFGSACGCMGPQDGDPLCPCAMRSELANNKAAVAARLMEEAS
jgi:hypothetical protein